MADEQPPSQASRPARPPIVVLITQVIFFLNAAVWVAFGILRIVDSAGNGSDWLITLLMFGNAAALAGLGWGLGTRHHRWAYYLALLVLFANVFLGVTDQVGLLDALVLVLNAVMLVLLLVKRPWYTAVQEQ